MRTSRCALYLLLLNFFAVGFLAWPVIAVLGALLGWQFGDADVINRYFLEPRRLLLNDLIESYLMTLPAILSFALFSSFVLWIHQATLHRAVLLICLASILLAVALLFYVPLNGGVLLLFAAVAGVVLIWSLLMAYRLSGCGHA